MSNFNGAPERPDSRIFASYPMPAKIDLLNERPRRESQVERQLADQIGQQLAPVPTITVSSGQQENSHAANTSRGMSPVSQQQHQRQQHQQHGWSNSVQGPEEFTTVRHSPTGRTEIKETRIIINQHSMPRAVDHSNHFEPFEQVTRRSVSPQPQMQQQQQSHSANVQSQQEHPGGRQPSQGREHWLDNQRITTTVTTTTTTNQQEQQQQQQQQQRQPSPNAALNKTISDNKALLALELAEKEAKLMREVAALHQRPYSPYQTPAKIDLTNESRAAQAQQQQVPAQPSRLPNSPTPNRMQMSQQDLMEKEAKLLREIEEMETKPYNPQTMLVEREQWFEYPENRPGERHLTESRRRVRDFCSLPPGLCQDRHVHEENLVPPGGRPSPTPGSIHTTIIRSPKREIDNKSPLPFAFDNFTTKGVRGNIASANAVEPERPRPPIFPIVKRSPSPNVARG